MRDKLCLRIKLGMLLLATLSSVVATLMLNRGTAYAEPNVFTITNVTIGAKSDTATGGIDSFADNVVKSNITFHRLNDYVEYIFTIQNMSSEEQTISYISDNNENGYILYEYDQNDGTKLAAGASLDLTVKAIYKNEITDISERAQGFSFALTINYNGKSETIIVNPSTGDEIVRNLVIFISASVALGLIAMSVIVKKRHKSVMVVVLISSIMLLIPAATQAVTILSLDLTIMNEYSIEDRYDVSFDDADIDSQIVVYGGKIIKPEDPTKEFHEFQGWFADENFETEFDFDGTTVTSDTVIYAKWREYDAIFDNDLIRASIVTIAKRTKVEKTFHEYGGTPTEAQLANAVDVSSTVDPIYIWDEDNNVYWWSPDDKPKLINVYRMFSDTSSYLTDFYLSGFDTSELIGLDSMFSSNTNSHTITFADDFDTSNVKSMQTTFANNTDLVSISFGKKFTTENVTNMESTFMHTASVKEYDLRFMNTKKVTNMTRMFQNCRALEKLIFGKDFDTSNVIKMEEMFNNLVEIEEIDLSTFNTEKVTTMKNMFKGDENLKKVDLSKFNPKNVTTIESMFSGDKALKEIIFPEVFDMQKLITASSAFYELDSIKELDLSSWVTSQTLNSIVSFAANNDAMERITFGPGFLSKGAAYMNSMLFGNKMLKKIDVRYWDTSRAYSFNSIFANCENLEEIILGEKFLLTNANNIESMFLRNPKLKTIYASTNFVIPESLKSSVVFKNDIQLVGGSGTTFNADRETAEYARIDNPNNGLPGYLTNINALPVEP